MSYLHHFRTVTVVLPIEFFYYFLRGFTIKRFYLILVDNQSTVNLTPNLIISCKIVADSHHYDLYHSKNIQAQCTSVIHVTWLLHAVALSSSSSFMPSRPSGALLGSTLAFSSRPQQGRIQPPEDECYFWRTTGCNFGGVCSRKHIPAHQGIDRQPWHVVKR